MLVLQNEDTGPEDLSKYRKRAFEYVEEEKIVLDALVVLYRKRLEIVQNHSKALEELRSTTMNILDTSSSLYDVLVRPVMDCLRKDIESYTQYTRDIEQDLTRITFTSGPRLEASIIEQDLDAVKRLYREYSASRIAVLELSPPPSMKRLPDEDIEHRRIAAKLHPKQKVARTHFETSYPKLLNDHMKYMEQVRRLVCGTILLVGDAIAVPYEKLELEQSRREYRHALILNPTTGNLEEDRTVILGRDIDPGSEEDFAGELLIACLERYPLVIEVYSLPAYTWWTASWEIIHRMESSQSIQCIYDIVSGLSNANVAMLLEVILINSRMNVPLLNLTDHRSASRLRENPWNRPALVNLMKDVNQNIKRILKACIIAYTTMHHHMYIVRRILLTRRNTSSPSMDWPLETILRRWDCDAWCPLAENVVWDVKRVTNEPPSLRRMKRFPGKSGDEVFLEVDQEGNIMDTPENTEEKVFIKEQSFSIKKLRKLMS
ncbi:hypothetical protein FRC14_007644 [Serendipita sp. 396]|nr:hypothetical protein FRC14_007644 [Serendipita sp. 396]